MTKKKLNIKNITNELEGASLFFSKATVSAATDPGTDKNLPAQTPSSPSPRQTQERAKTAKGRSSTGSRVSATKAQSEQKDNMSASMQVSNNASMQAINQPIIQDTIIETIRKAVKDVGKDSATYRFTPEEKKALLELSFSYKMQGYKTSENELVRVAINFILEDQKQNGRNSVLQRVLDALSR